MDRFEIVHTINATLMSILGSDVADAEDALRTYGKVNFVDEKIDDGLDDDTEDEYLMMRSFDVDIDGIDEPVYARLYYGNNSYELTTFDVS